MKTTGYLIPGVRAALRRGDCDEARRLVGDVQRGRLTARQQVHVARLLRTVERCDIKHAGVGRSRRRRLGAPPKFIGVDRGAATALSQGRWTPLRKDETTTIREYESPAGPWRLTATTDGEWFVRGPDPDAPGDHMEYASGTSTDIDSGRDADILKEAKKRAEVAYKAARAKAGLGRTWRARRRLTPRHGLTGAAGPTREAFLAAYRKELEAFGWAQKPAALERFLDTVEKALQGDPAGNWSPGGQDNAAKAWRAIGGKGRPTMKALRELPSERPVVAPPIPSARAVAPSTRPAPTGVEAFSANPKVRAALRMVVRYGEGGATLPRHEYIEREVAAGRRRVVTVETPDLSQSPIERAMFGTKMKATRRFEAVDGSSFFDERDMTKSGMDYAEWLTAQRK